MGHTHGIKWTQELIKQGILSVMNNLEINRMPTKTEVESITGDSALSNKIAKTGGFNHWAKKLNLKLKDSESKIGWSGEQLVVDMIKLKGYNVERMTVRHPYDLLINGAVKVDVKTSNRYYYTEKNYYHTFNLEKRNASCDLYVCLCMNNKVLEKVLVIPGTFLKITQLSVGEISTYNKYIDRWDYLESFDCFYKKLSLEVSL